MGDSCAEREVRIKDAEKEMAQLYSEVRHQEVLVESLRAEVCSFWCEYDVSGIVLAEFCTRLGDGALTMRPHCVA